MGDSNLRATVERLSYGRFSDRHFFFPFLIFILSFFDKKLSRKFFKKICREKEKNFNEKKFGREHFEKIGKKNFYIRNKNKNYGKICFVKTFASKTEIKRLEKSLVKNFAPKNFKKKEKNATLLQLSVAMPASALAAASPMLHERPRHWLPILRD